MNRSPLLLLSLLLVSCGKAIGAELPPAAGSGAVALPDLTKLAPTPSAPAARSRSELIVTGTSRPIHEAKIGPMVSGVIAAMLVEEGDRVKKGQVLFRLRSAAQDLGLKQAQAALASAEVQKSSADTELARTKALHEAGTVSPAVYDQVKARADALDAAIKQAQAAVNSARQASTDTVVTSPISGIVSSRRANVGETVTMMPPTTVLIVQDIDQLEVRAALPETALASLRPGSRATIRFPAINAVREVEITRINPSVDPFTRTIEVVAVVPNGDHELKAGMLVECDFRSPPSSDSGPRGSTAPKDSPRPSNHPLPSASGLDAVSQPGVKTP